MAVLPSNDTPYEVKASGQSTKRSYGGKTKRKVHMVSKKHICVICLNDLKGKNTRTTSWKTALCNDAAKERLEERTDDALKACVTTTAAKTKGPIAGFFNMWTQSNVSEIMVLHFRSYPSWPENILLRWTHQLSKNKCSVRQREPCRRTTCVQTSLFPWCRRRACRPGD